MGDHFGKVETELGPIWVGFGDGGITVVHPGAMSPEDFRDLLRRLRGREATMTKVPASIARSVRAAAAGRPSEQVAVDLAGLTPFQTRVLRLLQGIPRGQVRTYAWLARRAGRAGAARAVGNVMARNPMPLVLPCHRVVPSAGGVGHYAFGSDMKRDLLRREGARIWSTRDNPSRPSGAPGDA